MSRSRSRRVALVTLLLGAAIIGPTGAAFARDSINVRETMRFATEMAKRGSWREARFRWLQVLEQRPDDPRVLNNLAVASEALGDWDAATEYYRRSEGKLRTDERALDNRRRHERFRRRVLAQDTKDSGADTADPDGGRKPTNGKGRTVRVAVELPVPAKIDTSTHPSLLVASFLHEESALLDINHELVRYLRGRLRRAPGLDVLNITPAPAIPEQTLQELAINREFWRYLGREYETSLVVSGAIVFTRNDASGFRDVDTVSPVTGQKVRRPEFVEQEEFSYVVDILFFDGASGDLLTQDRVKRAAVFRGSNNDPITAFYELSDSIADGVLGIIIPGTRDDVRFVFKD